MIKCRKNIFYDDRSIACFFKHYNLEALVAGNIVLQQRVLVWSALKIPGSNSVLVQFWAVTIMAFPNNDRSQGYILQGEAVNINLVLIDLVFLLFVKIFKKGMVYKNSAVLIGVF